MSVEGLAGERCRPCTAATPPLTEAEIGALRESISPEWAVQGVTRLRREYRTKDFASGFALAGAVALLAESEGHHPDLEVGWGRLVISTTTHAIGGLSRNDFILAAKIDALAPAPPAPVKERRVARVGRAPAATGPSGRDLTPEEAARRVSDPNYLLPGEERGRPKDAPDWIAVYSELIEFKRVLLREAARVVATMAPRAREEAQTDQVLLAHQADRYRRRLAHWQSLRGDRTR